MDHKNNCVDERVHLAISPWDLTDDYNRHAGVTLLSFLDHCSLPVTAHILYDEKLSVGKEAGVKFNKQCYQEIADRYGCELVYHHVELPEWVDNSPIFKKAWSPGAMMRLYLPELLPNADKVIYLDCDIVVRTNIVDLWNIPLGSKYLAACLDGAIVNESPWNRKRLYWNVGIILEKYFNSGVLVLNLKELRGLTESFSDILLSYYKEHSNLPYPDQDLLNWFCRGDYVLLDEKYDVFSWWDNAMDYSDDCIIHYTLGKPWKNYSGLIDDYYWIYLEKTPWCLDSSDLRSYLRLAPDLELSRDIMSKHFFVTVYGSTTKKLQTALRFLFSVSIICIYDGLCHILRTLRPWLK